LDSFIVRCRVCIGTDYASNEGAESRSEIVFSETFTGTAATGSDDTRATCA
jgi:hypothetical protein